MQVNLWDLHHDKVYIKFKDDFHKEFFDKAIAYAGSQSKLAKLLSDSGENFSKNFKIDQQRISFWLHNYMNLRLDVVLYLSDMIGIDKISIQNNLELLKGIGTSLPIKDPKLPFVLTPVMANIIGKFICDGCILDSSHHYTSTYNNICQELIEEFIQEIKFAFGETQVDCPIVDGVIRARVTGFIGYIITNFFFFENGRKVPEIIKVSDRDIQCAFLRAVFDDEGTIHHKVNHIRVKMKYPMFLTDVMDMLNKLGIQTSKLAIDKSKRFGRPLYYFVIYGKNNMILFHQLIDFTHPRKKQRLTEHINRPVKHVSYKPGETVKLIFNTLQERPMTANEIGNQINRSKRTVQFFLDRLYKKRAVSWYPAKRKFVNEYVWQIAA